MNEIFLIVILGLMVLTALKVVIETIYKKLSEKTKK